MSPSSVLPSTSTSLLFPAATSSVITSSGQQLACHTAIFIVVIIVVVATICGTILLIWNDDTWTLTCQRSPMDPERSASSSSLVQWMLRYFFKTLVPTFQHLVRVTANPRHQLPPSLFTSSWFREPHLATPRPAMLHDRRSSRVPFNSHSDSQSYELPI